MALQRERKHISGLSYLQTPAEQRPAMQSVDAIRLYQELLGLAMDIPEEVKLAAMQQANEDCPPGHVAMLEEYGGRLRVVVFRK